MLTVAGGIILALVAVSFVVWLLEDGLDEIADWLG